MNDPVDAEVKRIHAKWEAESANRLLAKRVDRELGPLLDRNIDQQKEITRLTTALAQAERERDEAQANNNRAFCVWCGHVGEKTGEADRA